MTQTDAEGDEPDESAGTEADAETEASPELREILASGTFTLNDLSFEQITYEQVGVDVGVHAPADQLEANWGHKFVHPDSVPEFRGPETLKQRLEAQLDPYLNADSDRAPRERLIGPTGSAKTVAAKYFACKLADEDDEWPFDTGYPVFEITMSHVTSQAKLIGHPTMSEDGSDAQYILGPIPKALLASQVCPVVLFLDEVNRSPVKDALYEAIDGRRQIRIDGLGGGMILRGNPKNIIVVSAMNAGPGYKVEPLDFAEQRRLGTGEFINYLAEYGKDGIEDYPEWDGEDEEAQLVADLSPASKETAEHIVSAGQNIRSMARQGDERIKPIPTARLIEWAKTAHNMHQKGMDDALYEAGKKVMKGTYDQTRNFNQRQPSPLEKVITSEITDVKAVAYKPAEDDDNTDDGADGESDTDIPDDADELTDIPDVGPKLAERLAHAGYDTPDDLRQAVENNVDLDGIDGVGTQTAETIKQWADATAQTTPGNQSGETPTGVVKCKADCGFKIDAQTAETYREDETAHPDDGNDYSLLAVGRCPSCAQPITTES